MVKIHEVAAYHRIPDPSTMLGIKEVIDGKVLIAQEMRDRAYSYCGRWLLDSTIENRHPISEAAGEMATVADWECLEVEKPQLYAELAPIAAQMLERSGFEMPFSPVLAQVHDLDEARTRREAADSREASVAYQSAQTAVGIA
jgi:hypothetical protein